MEWQTLWHTIPLLKHRINSRMLLEAKNLRKSYGAHLAVADVSLTVDSGEIVGFLGPNGAGKTTTMSMLAGLLVPDSGSILLQGEAFHPRRLDLKPLLGVVPQDLAIYPDLTGAENLQFFGRLYGSRSTELAERCKDVLQQVGLTEFAHQRSGTYSGGMKRRLNFGVALMHRPRLLILDEPTVGVDPQSRNHLMDCIRQLAATGVGVLYASHYMEEVQSICQRVAIVDHGRVLAYDTIASLLDGLPAEVVLHVADCDAYRGELESLAGWEKSPEGRTMLAIQGHPAEMRNRLQAVLARLTERHIELLRVDTHESNLERYFLQLTGHTLRDG